MACVRVVAVRVVLLVAAVACASCQVETTTATANMAEMGKRREGATAMRKATECGHQPRHQGDAYVRQGDV